MSDENEILETDTKKKKSFNWVVICAIIAFAILLSFVILTINSSHDLAYKLNKQTTKQYKRIEKLNKEIEKHPDNYKLYLDRADAEYKKQKVFKEVYDTYNTREMSLSTYNIVEDIKKAKELNPNIDVDLFLGVVYAEGHYEYQKAIEYLTRHINKNKPNDYIPYYYRGICYFYSNDKVKNFRKYALDDLQKALELSPNKGDIYLALGDLYAFDYVDSNKTLEKSKQEAINYYDKAAKITEYNSNVYYKKAFLWYSNEDEHLSLLKQAASAKGANASTYILLADAYNEHNNTVMEINSLNKANDLGNELISIVRKCEHCTMYYNYEDFVSLYLFFVNNRLGDLKLVQSDLKSAAYYLNRCGKLKEEFFSDSDFNYCDDSLYKSYEKKLNDRRIKSYISSNSPCLKLLQIQEVKTSPDKNPILVVKNISGKPINNVAVTFNLYDTYDNIIDETYALAKQIGTKGSYTFKAPVLDFDNRIVKWELNNIQIRGEE